MLPRPDSGTASCSSRSSPRVTTTRTVPRASPRAGRDTSIVVALPSGPARGRAPRGRRCGLRAGDRSTLVAVAVAAADAHDVAGAAAVQEEAVHGVAEERAGRDVAELLHVLAPVRDERRLVRRALRRHADERGDGGPDALDRLGARSSPLRRRRRVTGRSASGPLQYRRQWCDSSVRWRPRRVTMRRPPDLRVASAARTGVVARAG